MTEILPVARVSLEDKLAYAGEGDYVGTLVPGVEGRLSADGELLLRGEALFAGYLGGPPVTEHATGDLARMDGREVALLGRRKDMIIRGDFNLYPELYEPTVERIPGVRRAAFVGVYDERAADERVVLVVEPESMSDAASLPARVARALRAGETRIDEPALPDEILAMPLPEGGRSSKVDKRALRALVRESLGESRAGRA
jgi:acyl-CoA synthetase (AMP-forming)/AMP-acid ligase II